MTFEQCVNIDIYLCNLSTRRAMEISYSLHNIAKIFWHLLSNKYIYRYTVYSVFK